MLYLCATPIGNLEDITFRAVRILKEADLIAAEDTRHTRKLLAHFDIHTPLTSYHQHNEAAKAGRVMATLLDGKNVALVSDAGMPGISDPGSVLVAEAIQAGIKVVPVPGPNAAIAGLVASGLSTERFVFEGFLPRSKKHRRQRLQEIAGEVRTVIIYEAPHRLLQMLEDLAEIAGSREIAVARELTKSYEQIIRGSAGRVLEYFRQNRPRGEFTVVISGASPGTGEHAGTGRGPDEEWPESVAEHVAMLMGEGLDKKQAMKAVAVRRGMAKRDVYNAMIDKK